MNTHKLFYFVLEKTGQEMTCFYLVPKASFVTNKKMDSTCFARKNHIFGAESRTICPVFYVWRFHSLRS